MLTIIETPHRGQSSVWTATDEEDFCVKVMAANPRANIDVDAGYAQIVEWLRADLRELTIVEVA